MKLLESYRMLVSAELNYAYFNALRTTPDLSGEGIKLVNSGKISFLVDSSKPGSPYFNRAVLPPDLESLESEIKKLPTEISGIEVMMPQQTEVISKLLMAAGFVPGYSLCYLVAKTAEKVAVAHEVVRLGPDQTDEFFDLLDLSGAAFTKEKRELKQSFYCTDQFRCYVARNELGQSTGWGTMYVSDGIGFLANSFTLPEFRCQGFQTALLHTRLNESLDLKLDCAFTDVEPGTQSHQNCERAGFQLLSNNVIWQRS